MDFAFTLDLLRAWFERQGQPYGVVGALGVAARGFSRTTFDVDIVAPAQIQAELISFLESSGYCTDHSSSGYSNHTHDNPDFGRLDVVYVSGETAEKIFSGVELLQGPGGEDCPVPRAEHLAAMKVFAIKNNPRRVLQDLEDIRAILELPGVDREEIYAYFRKSGLEDLLDRLK